MRADARARQHPDKTGISLRFSLKVKDSFLVCIHEIMLRIFKKQVQQIVDLLTSEFGESLDVTARDVAQNMLLTFSNNAQTAQQFFIDPKNGANYPLAVQTPQYRIESLDDLRNATMRGTGATQSLQNLASITPTTSCSGAEAPAVSPTLFLPINHSLRRSSGPSIK